MVIVKAQLRNLNPAQIMFNDVMSDSVTLKILISEKLSGKIVASKSGRFNTKRDNITEAELKIPIAEFTNWSPDKPFLHPFPIPNQVAAIGIFKESLNGNICTPKD